MKKRTRRKAKAKMTSATIAEYIEVRRLNAEMFAQLTDDKPDPEREAAARKKYYADTEAAALASGAKPAPEREPWDVIDDEPTPEPEVVP